MDGTIKNYNEVTGKLETEGELKNGKVEGTMKVYYPNGKIQMEANFKDDKLEGIVKRYDESGKITSEEFYKNGNRIK